MSPFRDLSFRASVLILFFTLSSSFSLGQASSTLRGKVVDALGGVILNATVSVANSEGLEKIIITDDRGSYVFGDLPPGTYTVRASAPGFVEYQSTAQIPADGSISLELIIELTIAVEGEGLTVTSERSTLSLDQSENAGALVLTGADLDALPDDPDELRDALLALAGPSAGPSGGEFYVDGFRGGILPPKSSIQEIRINQNPFSSEFDRFGRGRIQILTRPGSDRFQGWVMARFSDESLNSRDPFAPSKAPFQMRQFLLTLSGPLATDKASFFLHIDHREMDDNAVVSATVLDADLNVQPFSQVVVAPQSRTIYSPRLTYQFDENNTLSVRYLYLPSTRRNQGIGSFSLESRGFDVFQTTHDFSVRETTILSPRLVNEVGFRFARVDNRREGDNSVPTLQVLDAFTGGGSQVGLSSRDTDRWELKNSVAATLGRHSLKVGGSLRGIRVRDVLTSNFGGTYTFSGGLAPLLDSEERPERGGDGQPVLVSISSLERYRRTLLFQEQGKTPQEVRALGGGASQFSIAGGDPEGRVSQWDWAFFVQDDWRLHPDFLLSLGLRYEAQTNISDHIDFAPRLTFAWSPGMLGSRQRTTVIRGGFGIFYDRFSEDFTLEANRFDGVKQERYILNDPDFFPNIPTTDQLKAAAVAPTVVRLGEDLKSPYAMQSTLSIEQQLPSGFLLAASYINTRMNNVLYSRNASIDLPSTDIGNLFEYKSGGVFNQNQMIIGLRNRFSRTTNFTASYVLSRASSNTDGARDFPSNGFDLTDDYGRASTDVRHYFTVIGTLGIPGGLQLNPFVVASSGRPFDITTGRDANGDTLFTERPAFATDINQPGVIVTPFGVFDPDPSPDQSVILRNFGQGPSFFLVNLNISKSFGFGSTVEPRAEGGGSSSGGHSAPGSVPGAPPTQGPGGLGNSMRRQAPSPYNLTFTLQLMNLLNHPNFGPVIGNLTSPLFGQSNSTASAFGSTAGGAGPRAAGNRRIQLAVRLSF